jgi:hypothetical protein
MILQYKFFISFFLTVSDVPSLNNFSIFQDIYLYHHKIDFFWGVGGGELVIVHVLLNKCFGPIENH